MISQTEKYCKDCGKVINVKAEICPHCGVRQMQPNYAFENQTNRTDVNQRWLITLILCFLGGTIGLHNFYNRKIGYGIFQILTLGGLGIWVLIDLIMIVLGNFKDNDGNYLKYNNAQQ